MAFEFVLIPAEISERVDLNGNEKLVLSFVLGFSGKFRASNEYVGKCVGLSAGSVANIMSKLRKKGLMQGRRADRSPSSSGEPSTSSPNEAKPSLPSEQIVYMDNIEDKIVKASLPNEVEATPAGGPAGVVAPDSPRRRKNRKPEAKLSHRQMQDEINALTAHQSSREPLYEE